MHRKTEKDPGVDPQPGPGKAFKRGHKWVTGLTVHLGPENRCWPLRRLSRTTANFLHENKAFLISYTARMVNETLYKCKFCLGWNTFFCKPWQPKAPKDDFTIFSPFKRLPPYTPDPWAPISATRDYTPMASNSYNITYYTLTRKLRCLLRYKYLDEYELQ
jgi:hypothetical protein